MQQKLARLIQRHNTAAIWTQYNPILLLGEIGFETDTHRFKVGDGETPWEQLDYYTTAENPRPKFYTAGEGLFLDTRTNLLSANLRYQIIAIRYIEIYRNIIGNSNLSNSITASNVKSIQQLLKGSPLTGSVSGTLLKSNLTKSYVIINTTFSNGKIQPLLLGIKAPYVSSTGLQGFTSSTKSHILNLVTNNRISQQTAFSNTLKVKTSENTNNLLRAKISGIQLIIKNGQIIQKYIIAKVKADNLTSQQTLSNNLIENQLFLGHNAKIKQTLNNGKLVSDLLFGENNKVRVGMISHSGQSNFSQGQLIEKANITNIQSKDRGSVVSPFNNVIKSSKTINGISGSKAIGNIISTFVDSSTQLFSFLGLNNFEAYVSKICFTQSSNCLSKSKNIASNYYSLKDSINTTSPKGQLIFTISPVISFIINNNSLTSNQVSTNSSPTKKQESSFRANSKDDVELISAPTTLNNTTSKQDNNLFISDSINTQNGQKASNNTLSRFSGINQPVWRVINTDSRPSSNWSRYQGWLIIRQAERTEQNLNSSSSYYKMVTIY